MEPIRLWPELIYKYKCPVDLTEMAEMAISLCKDTTIHNLEQGGGRSTFNTHNDLISRPEFTELRNWMINCSQEVWGAWELLDMKRYVHRSWANWHPPGGWTAEHDHGSTHQVIVVYLRQPENGGNIMFKDPMQYTKAAYPKSDLAKEWRTVEVKQNDVLFFPGFMRHMTEPNNSNADRTVMTINVCIDFFAKAVDVVY